MPALLIAIPLTLVLILNLPIDRIMRRIGFWSAMAIAGLQVVAALLPNSPVWKMPLAVASTIFFKSGFTIDPLAMVMFLSIGIVSLAALMVARYAIADKRELFNMVNVVLVAIAGMNGIVLMSDFFSLYVFIEVASVASFVLIAFERGRDAYEGAFKYIVLSALASTMMLASIALLFVYTGGVSFAEVQTALRGGFADAAALPIVHSRFVIVAAVLFIGGLSIKSGLVPFHGWLPDAYSSAPAPISVLLAGVITKTVGVYTLMRIVGSVFGPIPHLGTFLMIVGVVSIVFGAFAAIDQRDMKRMLAYSSISQVGYIILGLGVGTPLGFAGALLHIFNHATFKTLLFVNSAAIEGQIGTRDMDKLGGISKRMPVTGTTSAVAFLSTAGIPPLAGFWSKLMIVVAAWYAGHYAFAVVAILAGVITLGYFLLMQRKVFFGLLRSELSGIREANGWILVPSIALALITAGVGFAIPWLMGTYLIPVRSFL